MDGLPELDGVQRAVVVGEGIAAMAATTDGRDFLLEIASRCRPSVMDASHAQLVDADRRAGHAHAAVRLALAFTWPEQCATLGEFMTMLPEDVREEIADHLIAAGMS